MKIRIIFLFVIAFSGAVYPQAAAPNNKPSGEVKDGFYFENFEGPVFPPAGWQAISMKGHNWRSSDEPFSGKYCAYMPYGGGSEWDWLIMPRFSVKAGDMLKFYYKSYYNISFDSLYVLVSTDSVFASDSLSLVSSFPNVLAGINLLNDLGKWNLCSLSLNQYAGQEIYVAFKIFRSSDNYDYIDCAGIGNFLSSDVSAISAITRTNGSQGISIPIKAEVLNMGTEMRSFTVNCAIPETDYISSKQILNLQPYAIANAEFDQWTPANTGAYDIKIYSDLSGDLNKNNDTVSEKIKITESVQGLAWRSEKEAPAWLSDGAAAAYTKTSGDESVPDKAYIFLAGGWNGNGIKTIRIYDEQADTWAESSVLLPSYLHRFGTVTIGGKIYMPGGFTEGGVSKAIYIYDIESNTIGKGADMPEASADFAIGSYADSLIYVIGGLGGTKVMIYNLKDDAWSYGTPYPESITFLYGGLCGSKIVITGENKLFEDFYLDSANTVYVGEINPENPSIINWKRGEDFPSQAYSSISAGAWFGKNKKYLFFTGGYCNSGMEFTTETWAYDIETDKWIGAPNINKAGAYPSHLVPVVKNDSAFMVAAGGYGKLNEWLYLGNNDAVQPGGMDVMVKSIDAADTLSRKVSNPINASFKNMMLKSQTFEVTAEITPGSYRSVDMVNSLGFLAVNQLSFDPWLPDSSGTYTLTATAILPGDADQKDNTLSKIITVVDSIIEVEEEPNIPAIYSLSQNYPNPFNPSTIIKYSVAEAGQVELRLYNILGQEVITLVNDFMKAGQHEVYFNAAALNLSSGVYLYRIKSGSFVQTKKLVLIK